jgi:indolepyruvate ferredoxin oxidoreductase
MGGEGAQWIGIAPFTDDPHFVQNLGDGTFHHSGSLAVRAAVAAGVTMTYKILYNNAVAMTGGQQPQGQMDVPAMCRLLEAEGVQQIVITTPEPSTYQNVVLPSFAKVRHRDELQEAQRELASVAGVTVLIHDDRCAAEKRRLRKRGRLETPAERIVINERVCEGCGDCGEQSTCMSLIPVDTEFGRKTHVHQSSCNFDRSCLKGNCPSFVLVTPRSKTQNKRVVPEPPLTFPPPQLRVPTSVAVRMPGVGGTGVVTVSAILQMAAYLDGLYAAGLDQIGLAQKGGPVVSDVRISDQPIEGQLRASNRSVDVILGLDVLGATSADTQNVADPLRTVAVLNSTVIPTAGMIKDVGASASTGAGVFTALDAVTRREENVIIDAGGLAETLFDDHFAANMILLGAAFQHGCLPVTAESIERAIGLNGASVAANVQAFRWGRATIADPEAIARALTSEPTSVVISPEVIEFVRQRGFAPWLVESLALRYAELSDYQNAAYASRFLDDIETVFAKEQLVDPDGGFNLTSAYARGLFKLMAYKDEYEVARLHLNERDRYLDQFGQDARIRVLLHPPTMKAFGLKRKISLGPSAFVSFRILRRGRRLRGTKLDPFGYAGIRKIERELIREYRDLVVELSATLTKDNWASAVLIAELPDLIRGYDEVKLKNIQLFRARRGEILAQRSSPSVEPSF